MATVGGLFAGPANPPASMPKAALDAVDISTDGLEGDRNLYRHAKKAGDPDMAVLLLTREELDTLAGKGWSFDPGDMGENILLEGIALADLAQPDRTLAIGEVRLQISRICDPCSTMHECPGVGEGNITRLMAESLGLRGWYARVLSPGTVRIGDAVSLDG